MSTLHQVVLILGIFFVPLALLIAGHRLKRGTWRRQRAFWGGVAGHLVALGLATWASLVPPLGWQDTDVARGALGVWSLVLLPIAGAVIGALRTSSES